jgi:hypothetical protein
MIVVNLVRHSVTARRANVRSWEDMSLIGGTCD